MPIDAYAVHRPGQALDRFQYDPEPLGPHDVEIEITHCGICHSDIHLIKNEWGINEYPLVPGHEIVGMVRQLGGSVTGLRPGQRVGVGWQRSSCLECGPCNDGDENLCTHLEATCIGHYGGYASAIRTDSRFAFPIPDALDSASAAPLLCAGITVFAPLRRHGIGRGSRIGVLGIGGLGHLAIQFADALGAEVTALSSSPDKKMDALKLGADHFIDTSDGAKLKRAGRSLDLILSTVSADVEWVDFLAMLKPDGLLCLVGVPNRPVTIPAFSLIGGQKGIVGSAIGGRIAMREMLEFAATHGVRPRVETMPLSQVNTAVSRVEENKARFRIVLEV